MCVYFLSFIHLVSVCTFNELYQRIVREISENARRQSCICVSFLRVSQRKQQKDSWGVGGERIKHTLTKGIVTL